MPRGRDGGQKSGCEREDPSETETDLKIKDMLEDLKLAFESCSIRDDSAVLGDDNDTQSLVCGASMVAGGHRRPFELEPFDGGRLPSSIPSAAFQEYGVFDDMCTTPTADADLVDWNATTVVPLWVPPPRGVPSEFGGFTGGLSEALSPGDTPHSQWLIDVPHLPLPAPTPPPHTPSQPPPHTAATPLQHSCNTPAADDDEEMIVFVPKGARTHTHTPAHTLTHTHTLTHATRICETSCAGGGGGAHTSTTAPAHTCAPPAQPPASPGRGSLSLNTEGPRSGGGFGIGGGAPSLTTPHSPSAVEGPWGGVAPGVVLPELVLAAAGKEGVDDQAYAHQLQSLESLARLRSALDRILEFTTHKESRTELTKSLLKSSAGGGAEILAALVHVVGGGGVEAGACRETALGALVNISMAKESRHAMYQTAGLECGLMHALDVSLAGSTALNLAVKVFRNLSDQGGADNRAHMFKAGLPEKLVRIMTRETRAERSCDTRAERTHTHCLKPLGDAGQHSSTRAAACVAGAPVGSDCRSAAASASASASASGSASGSPSASASKSSDIVNAALNTMSNLASHNASRPRLLATPGVAQVLVKLVSTAEPNSRLLRLALVCLTNLSCHKDNRVAMMKMGLADLLVTLTLTATPESKHLEAALIMLVNMSAMPECRFPLVQGGSGQAAVAVIRACQGGVGHSKNHLIALQIVQNLSADKDTGPLLIAQGGLGVALSSAHNADTRVSAVAAGVLSNLALYGRQNGGKVCRILVEHGAIEALQTLIQRPERTGLSAAKAAAFLFGIEGPWEVVGGSHELLLLQSCGGALKRLCEALTQTLDGRELYGVTFDVYELVLAIQLIISTHPDNRRIFTVEQGPALLVRVAAERAHEPQVLEATLETFLHLSRDPPTAAWLRAQYKLGAFSQLHDVASGGRRGECCIEEATSKPTSDLDIPDLDIPDLHRCRQLSRDFLNRCS